MARKLTPKQEMFVEEYLIDLNATQAAIRAGYSVKTANEQGSRLLANVSVSEAISKYMAERSKRIGVNQDRIVMELSKIAFVNINDVVEDDGSIRKDATADDLAAIESVKVKYSSGDTGHSSEHEVKLSPKMKALELLGKHIGMWSNKLDLNVTLPVIIEGENNLED